MNMQIDVRTVLPSIRVPTLVLHRRGDPVAQVEAGRYLAERIARRPDHFWRSRAA
jgi:pimeloyl-ACP methyl ester carboxylesterase